MTLCFASHNFFPIATFYKKSIYRLKLEQATINPKVRRVAGYFKNLTPIGCDSEEKYVWDAISPRGEQFFESEAEASPSCLFLELRRTDNVPIGLFRYIKIQLDSEAYYL